MDITYILQFELADLVLYLLGQFWVELSQFTGW